MVTSEMDGVATVEVFTRHGGTAMTLACSASNAPCNRAQLSLSIAIAKSVSRLNSAAP